ncbi:MAG: outer membrane beta-barrel protein [Verrucomicrobiota bacterium]|jgi:hypothetical protein
MKCNAWTLALVGAGLLSPPAATWAEEKPSSVLTALSSTTLSGYVDTSAHWNLGTRNANLPPYTPNGQPGGTKADGFNLDVVALTLNKTPGEEAWSAGYNATLLLGPDAVGYNTSFLGARQAAQSDFSLKDTYLELHAPLGNGLDLKLGTFTEIIGYEVYEAANNPNYTRSYGYIIEPTQMTGWLAAYQLCPSLLLNAGLCDTWSAGVNSRSFNTAPARAESFKTYMASLAFAAPTNSGAWSGSTLSGGVINGWDAANLVDKTSFYIGGTLNTPITNVKLGAAYDYVILGPNTINGTPASSGYQNAAALYLNWQATEKLAFNTRGEYFSQSGYLAAAATAAGAGLPKSAFALTQTVQYDLWKNVIARAEFRWDHAADASNPFANGVDNAFLLAANLIFKF